MQSERFWQLAYPKGSYLLSEVYEILLMYWNESLPLPALYQESI